MRIFPIFCQIFFSHQTQNGSFSGCVALICDCLVQHNSYHFPVSHWDGSMTYREISVSHWLVWITYRARHWVTPWTSIIIYIYSFICFNGITHTAVFFLYLFSFAYACESKKRGFTLHICSESPINRGNSGREPSLHRYSPKRHKWRKTVNPWCTKSPRCERFFIVFCQQNEHFELVNTHIVMSCYVNTVSQRVLLIKWSTIFFIVSIRIIQ